jgi:sugar phosphate isomerase/epimerase
MRIGCMVWRVDGVLDFYEQVAHIQAQGFEAVEFWTLPGQPGVWQGFDVSNASRRDVQALKDALARFDEVDLHAGFDLSGTPHSGFGTGPVQMEPTFALAAEIGAQVITVHPDRGLAGPAEIAALQRIEALAARYETMVGIEPMGGKGAERRVRLLSRLSLPHVGLTLDVGHMYFENGAAFAAYGTLGNLVRMTDTPHVRVGVVHVHAHDYDGADDHLAIGRGRVDWGDVIGALHQAGFSGSLCLELNPFREPESARESRVRLRRIIESLEREGGAPS